jgi:tetratricopeptide (TPR) repeat protein
MAGVARRSRRAHALAGSLLALAAVQSRAAEDWRALARAALARAESAVAAGDLERAAREHEAARSACDAPGRGGLLLARALDGLGDAARARGDFAVAVEQHARAAALLETLLGPTQPRLATTLHNLGIAHAAIGRADDARQSLGRALAIWEATLGAQSAEARTSRRALAALDTAR